jgi:hypothetical protein
MMKCYLRTQQTAREDGLSREMVATALRNTESNAFESLNS